MARYTGASCRLCRRENLKMYLKGDRCYSDKCAFERRAYAPGQHGQNRFKKQSDYAIQLREKQKVKQIFGMLENQFIRYFYNADQARGITGENLLQQLEMRLDSAIFHLGFACSRTQGRQLVKHNHFLVNNHKVNIPSFQVKAGDVISMKESSRKIQQIIENIEAVIRRGIPIWLELDSKNFLGTVKGIPSRDEISMPIQEQLIVELYSK